MGIEGQPETSPVKRHSSLADTIHQSLLDGLRNLTDPAAPPPPEATAQQVLDVGRALGDLDVCLATLPKMGISTSYIVSALPTIVDALAEADAAVARYLEPLTKRAVTADAVDALLAAAPELVTACVTVATFVKTTLAVLARADALRGRPRPRDERRARRETFFFFQVRRDEGERRRPRRRARGARGVRAVRGGVRRGHGRRVERGQGRRVATFGRAARARRRPDDRDAIRRRDRELRRPRVGGRGRLRARDRRRRWPAPASVQETPGFSGVFRLWRPVSRSIWVRFGYFLDR